MKVVASFAKPEDAHLARMRLESGGIEANVRDELTASVYSGIGPAIGGVRVEVPDDRYEEARRLLGIATGKDTPVICPVCGSRETRVRKPGPLTAIGVGLGIARLARSAVAECASCGHVFSIAAAEAARTA